MYSDQRISIVSWALQSLLSRFAVLAVASLWATTSIGGSECYASDAGRKCAHLEDPCDNISVGAGDILLSTARRRAAEGDCNARSDAAMKLLTGELGLTDKALAHRVLKELADAECPRAMLYWGKILLYGAGTPQDPDEALRLLAMSGERGEPVGWYLLCRAYARGEGLPKDEGRGREFMDKAAQAGYTGAVLDKAILSLASDSEPEAISKALADVRRLAESGFARAQAMLSRLYVDGRYGLSKDFQLAGVWGERAALQGEVLAFALYAAKLMDEHPIGSAGFQRAVMFVYLGAQAGERVAVSWWSELEESLPRSEREAAKLLAEKFEPVPSESTQSLNWSVTAPPTGELSIADTRALEALDLLAARGDVAAAASLAEVYFHGRGRPKDRTKAGELLLVAARAGNPISQRALGRLHLSGCGLPKDPKQSAYWFRVAAYQGLEDQKGLQGAESLLSSADRVAVENEAKQFKPVVSPRR
jgi:uncharacterized protein